MKPEDKVVEKVFAYFSEPKFSEFSITRECEIQMGTDNRVADIVLRDADGRFIAVAECKAPGGADYGIPQLKSYLSATDTRFGLFAPRIERDSWVFYENLRRNVFSQIDLIGFEKKVLEGQIGYSNSGSQFTQISLILQGDITRVDVDAIVNSTNSRLSGREGLDRVIQSAGGENVRAECRQILNTTSGLNTGHSVITTGGNLTAGHIIHTVGPFWSGGDSGESEHLANCYRNSLQLAVEKGIRSIAFPTISTGGRRYPREAAASVALATVIDFIEQENQHGGAVPNLIQFFLDKKSYICYVSQLSQRGFDLVCNLPMI